MDQKMYEHHASVTVDAPVHQVYSLFSHFNDFPKFMSFVKEVTYYDSERSHWVADVAGRHEWDAVNENWIPDRQISWRSVNGLSNSGRVEFQPTSTQQTRVDVSINYSPPASLLGALGEYLGVGRHFENALQHDLNHFAQMVKQAPAGALDPSSSNYLFHDESAAARGTTTERQNATMAKDASTTGSTRATEMPIRNESTQNYGERASSGATAESGRIASEGFPPDRPVMDRDIANEPINTAPSTGEPISSGRPTLDQDILERPASASSPASERNIGASPDYTSEDQPNLPPEQIPGWERPEGNQPRP
jgi:uncharacterized membrane protein